MRQRPVSAGAACAAAASRTLVAEYADSVLLQSPMPDFSMPYNVITLTCTVLALFFGRYWPGGPASTRLAGCSQQMSISDGSYLGLCLCQGSRRACPSVDASLILGRGCGS